MNIVKLTPYNPDWPSRFEAESEKILAILGSNCIYIYHVGSTAIPSVYAKPIIDILLVVLDINQVDQFNSKFEKLGYICRGEYGIPSRRYFKKIEKDQAYHIHIFQQGNTEIQRHITFKNRLIERPEEAFAYSWIKRCLAEQFTHNIHEYTDGKDSFIRMINYRTGNAKADQLNACDNIVLKAFSPNWLKLGSAEINAINKVVSLPYEAIEHLGSTSIPGLSAKPTIDIFLALDSIEQAEQWIKPLESMGYDYWSENPDPMHRRFFKGMPPYGISRTHHLHILPKGPDFNDRILFRDTLKCNERLRDQYEKLKLHLAQNHPEDREAYTNAKAQFINGILNKRK